LTESFGPERLTRGSPSAAECETLAAKFHAVDSTPMAMAIPWYPVEDRDANPSSRIPKAFKFQIGEGRR